MRWENLTSDDFKKSLEVTKGVAIIPYGCLEKHGNQLPLGTDMFIADNLAYQASLIEEALVVPIAPYGIISEAQHTPGCLSISSNLQYKILEELCDELARNGYHKIIILDGHGGARNFLNYFIQSRLEKPHDYICYVYHAHYHLDDLDKTWVEKYGKMRGSGHADIKESSEICYLHPELVHIDRIDSSDDQTQDKQRLNEVVKTGAYTAIGWYADHPYHIAGDPTGCDKEKGKMLTDYYVSCFVKAIKAIKNDKVGPELLNEFYELRNNPIK